MSQLNSILEGFLDTVEQSLRASASEKRQIVRELRSHLWERFDALKREVPDADDDVVARRVLEEFGNPRDLALAYEGETTVLKKPSGETILRVTRAVGRGTGRVLKVVAISLAVLLVLAIGLAMWAFYEVRPYVEEIVASHAEFEVYDYWDHCREPCTYERTGQSFFVEEGVRSVRFDVDVHGDHDVGNHGSVTVVVYDPTGAERFNRTFELEERSFLSEQATWGPMAGDWSIDLSVHDFVGYVSIDAATKGTSSLR